MPKVISIMALDYGEARIGVAIANSMLQIPHPITSIEARNMWAKIDRVALLINHWQPQLLIVGIPTTHDNLQKIQLINTIQNFAKRLHKKFQLPIELINEDFSSADAKLLLNEQGLFKHKQQRGKLDQLAACAILQSYFCHKQSS